MRHTRCSVQFIDHERNQEHCKEQCPQVLQCNSLRKDGARLWWDGTLEPNGSGLTDIGAHEFQQEKAIDILQQTGRMVGGSWQLKTKSVTLRDR